MIRKTIFRHLYFQVLLAIILGACLGVFYPHLATHLKFLGDLFIKLIRMLVAPIIFTTVVVAMAGMGSFKRAGRIGLKALIYFEAATTAALVIGWLVVKWIQPGAGVNADPAKLDSKAIAPYVTGSKTQGFLDILMNVVPSSVVDAFARGEIIQGLFFSLLF